MCSLRENDGIRPDITPWLGSLVVDPKYQRQGIGNMLIDTTLLKARSFVLKSYTCLLSILPCQNITSALGGGKSVWMNLNYTAPISQDQNF